MAELPRAEIVRRLEALGRERASLPRRDLAPAVRARIEAGAPSGAGRRRARATRRTLAIAIVCLLLAAAAALAAAPVRDELLDLLGIRGVAVEEVPEPPRLPEPAKLELGPRTSPAAAERRAGFRLLSAHSPELGRPGAIHVREVRGRPIVSFAYPPSPMLPELGSSGTAVVLSELAGGLDPALLKKTVAIGEIEAVDVGGARGYWLGGGHVVSLLDRSTGTATERRRTGNVLLWRRGPITLRLEAEIPKARALALALTVR